jgi:segregation and condensation protein B
MDDKESLNSKSKDSLKSYVLRESEVEKAVDQAYGGSKSNPASASRVPLTEPAVEDVHSYRPDTESLIKAILFASPEYVSQNTIKEILGNDLEIPEIRKVIKNINLKLSKENEPFEIAEANNSFCLRTRSQFHPWIKKLFRESNARKLSPAALEILSLVAYKQPITRAEIENIRGVNVDGVIKGLLEKKLITITGRSDCIGSPLTYGTTKEFLKYFGINRVPQDLPKLSEFEDLISSTDLLPQISKEGEIIEKRTDETRED